MIEVGSDQNRAMIGNLVMARDDDEPVPDFRERARDLALSLGADMLIFALLELVWVDDVQTIEIAGGLKDDATGDFATIGGSMLVELEDGELMQAFRVRARARAFAFGSDSVVFGGLRPMPMNYEGETGQ